MQIYDISRELFSAKVYPGDPIPAYERVLSLENGAVCNLSRIEMGSHSSTHLDAPLHFVPNGKSVEKIDLEKCVGECRVVSLQGSVEAGNLMPLLDSGCRKLLIRGEIELGVDAARAIAASGVELLGVEGFTVGNPETSEAIHRILLEKEVVIMEALSLQEIQDGVYFLCALPLKLADLDGSPCRAILISNNLTE